MIEPDMYFKELKRWLKAFEDEFSREPNSKERAEILHILEYNLVDMEEMVK